MLRTGDTPATVTVRAASLTYQARVSAGVPGVRYSDNYLDLRPADEVTVTLDGLPVGFDLAAIVVQAYAER